MILRGEKNTRSPRVLIFHPDVGRSAGRSEKLTRGILADNRHAQPVELIGGTLLVEGVPNAKAISIRRKLKFDKDLERAGQISTTFTVTADP